MDLEEIFPKKNGTEIEIVIPEQKNPTYDTTEDVIVEVSCVVKKVKEVVKILLADHDRCCCKEKSSVSASHENLCTTICLVLPVAHFVRLITED